LTRTSPPSVEPEAQWSVRAVGRARGARTSVRFNARTNQGVEKKPACVATRTLKRRERRAPSAPFQCGVQMRLLESILPFAFLIFN